MNVEARREGTNLVLKADGRVDGTNASEFQDAMKTEINETDRAVVLDLQDLTYISSAGLRVVLLIAKDLQRQGAKMAACSLSEPVKGSISSSVASTRSYPSTIPRTLPLAPSANRPVPFRESRQGMLAQKIADVTPIREV